MTLKEMENKERIKLAIGALPGIRIFNNPVGTAPSAPPKRRKNLKNGGMILEPPVEWIRYGLHSGSGDLIGWRSFVIQPHHVGMTVAQFFSCEVKRTIGGVVEDHQQHWADTVNSVGGFAIIVNSPEAALRAIQEELTNGNGLSAR